MPREQWAERRHAAYLARIDEVTIMPLAREIWGLATALGLAQGCVSNAPRIIAEANLFHLGPVREDIVLVSRDDVARGKPHPEPYRLGAQRLGVSRAEVAATEDSGSGLRSALAARRRDQRFHDATLRGGQTDGLNQRERLA